MADSGFSGDETAPFFGFLGAAAALVFSCMGAAYGTAKSGVGVASMGVMRPELVMKSIVPVVMAGVLGIYGLIIAVIISTGINPKAKSYYLFDGYAHLSSGLACGLAGLSAGMAIGIVGDAGVRANAQQPKLFVGMILILIFAEALALYGLIVGFSGDETAPFFGFLGAAAALVFSCMGAAYGTAKSGVGGASMGVMRPELVMKSIVPVVMAGVLGIYGLIIAVIISTGINPKAKSYYLFDGYAHLSSGLACGLAGLSAGMAIGIVGDAGVRANAQQPKLFVGMILILIFAEALALYGLIVGIILSSRAGQSRAD
ncbi:hypothetical protein OSB04_014196 [Centaurea solstitialis]|uniref:V-type proton ATPase proteolipid subunit n=1 Tax=Centaurea solstitialis TaxID=347529 RepID=A0AA38T7W9_9ASTR|nr:hypothetical protein OSB04_014196 [Centaurea solstitialis]